MTTKHAVWLMFEKDDHDYLFNIIRDISSEYNSHKFEPHITIQGLTDVRKHIIEEYIKKCQSHLYPFTIRNNGLDFCDNIWKSLFIKIENNTHLQNIWKILNFEQSDDLFEPHISLIYKNLALEEKRKITTKLNLKDNFNVSYIAVMKFDDDINKWRIESKCKL
ncbi:hypothetical protein [Nitrosopumilus sp. S4]